MNSRKDATARQGFAVLSLNLRFGLADDGPNRWGIRKTALPLLFERHPADFIGLQEANDFQIDDVQQVLNSHGRIGKRSPAPRFWQNNVIFYHLSWRCVGRRHFFLSPTPDVPSRFRNSRWPRQCTLGLFEKNGRRLICISTHFDFDASVQEASAEIVLSRLAEWPADVPAVLMGDFNASPQSPCYRRLTAATEPERFPSGVFRNAFPLPYPGTYHGFSGRPTGDCIDWILYRGGLRAQGPRVIQDAFNGILPSDHFPIRSAFEFSSAFDGR
jgi:endonuclease/exonuclease/phosphatase family metal-dependent hydrolase